MHSGIEKAQFCIYFMQHAFLEAQSEHCTTMCHNVKSINQTTLSFQYSGMQNQSKEGGTLWKSLLHLFSDAAMADFSGGCGYCHNDITLPRELWLVRVGHPETCENNYEWYFVLALTVCVIIPAIRSRCWLIFLAICMLACWGIKSLASTATTWAKA